MTDFRGGRLAFLLFKCLPWACYTCLFHSSCVSSFARVLHLQMCLVPEFQIWALFSGLLCGRPGSLKFKYLFLVSRYPDANATVTQASVWGMSLGSWSATASTTPLGSTVKSVFLSSMTGRGGERQQRAPMNACVRVTVPCTKIAHGFGPLPLLSCWSCMVLRLSSS